VAVLLDDVDPSNVAAVTSRAHRLMGERGDLKSAAWATRFRGTIALMDRDPYVDGLVFDGATPIRAEVFESAFGLRIPAPLG
jgi:hypothetical protein